MPIPTDAEMIAYLEEMYDNVQGSNQDSKQATIITAIEAHKLRMITELDSPQEFDWNG